jgi:hypothetical protein
LHVRTKAFILTVMNSPQQAIAHLSRAAFPLAGLLLRVPAR